MMWEEKNLDVLETILANLKVEAYAIEKWRDYERVNKTPLKEGGIFMPYKFDLDEGINYMMNAIECIERYIRYKNERTEKEKEVEE